MQTESPPPSARVTVSISLPTETRDLARWVARDEHRTLSNLVFQLLETHFIREGYREARRGGRRS